MLIKYCRHVIPCLEKSESATEAMWNKKKEERIMIRSYIQTGMIKRRSYIYNGITGRHNQKLKIDISANEREIKRFFTHEKVSRHCHLILKVRLQTI